MHSMTDPVPFAAQADGGRRSGTSAASLGSLLPTNKWALAWSHWVGMGKPSLAEPIDYHIFKGSQVLGSLSLETDKQQLFALLPTIGLKCKA